MFGKRLAALRTQKGLSQYELAQALGFSRGQIANYEQGKREPDFATLITLANFFEVSLDYLLGRTEMPDGSFLAGNETDVDKGEEVFRGIREDISEYEIEYLKESLKALRKFNQSVAGQRLSEGSFNDRGSDGKKNGGDGNGKRQFAERAGDRMGRDDVRAGGHADRDDMRANVRPGRLDERAHVQPDRPDGNANSHPDKLDGRTSVQPDRPDRPDGRTSVRQDKDQGNSLDRSDKR